MVTRTSGTACSTTTAPLRGFFYDQHQANPNSVVPGCYLETIAFTSSNLPPAEDDGRALEISRRYLDANPVTYKWHTGTTDDDFDTQLGLNISQSLDNLAHELKITRPFGVVPHDYFLHRHPYGHPRSVLTVFAEKVIPEVVCDRERHGHPRVVIGNAGSLRFDVVGRKNARDRHCNPLTLQFAGPFDRNDELTVSPFNTEFLYTRLPAGLAGNITVEMNRAGASKFAPSVDDDEAYVRHVYNEWLASQWDRYVQSNLLGGSDELSMTSDAKKPRTLGYVTHDACKGRGDDIEHIPVPYSPDQVWV